MDQKNQTNDTATEQRPYEQPEVKTYGNIREITRAVGKAGVNDGASSKPSKTSLV